MAHLVIVANGPIADPAAEARLYLRPGDRLVAADGGVRHLLALGLRPERIIGDGDSLPAEQNLWADIPFTRYPVAKDETDLELALLWAAQQPEDPILVWGALGGRPDHELANLLLLALPALTGKRVWMVGNGWRVTCLRAGETLTVSATPGLTLSLIPLGGTAEGVRTQGLRYPLHDEALLFGPARGVSNVLQEAQATITLRRGWLWCFIEEHPTLSW